MRLVFASAAVTAALSAAAVASAMTGFSSSPKLAPAAGFVAGKPVTVWCANSEYEWRQYGGTSSEHGLAVPGSSEIKLDPDVCRYLRMRTLPVAGGAAALLVLVHEAIHARGETNEGITDCDAIHEMPRVAVKFFHVTAGKQLRSIMASAWRARATEPPAYRTVC